MTALPLAADQGFSFADTFSIGLLFVGVAVFAAVGALSHERERAFSASLIYLGLGILAAVTIEVFDITWLDPTGDAVVIEHVAEVALIFALFSSGLKLDRRFTGASGVGGAVVAIAMPLTILGVTLFLGVMGLSLRRRALLCRRARADGPVLAGDSGVGPPGDEDEHDQLRADRGGRGNTALRRRSCSPASSSWRRAGRQWIGEWLLPSPLRDRGRRGHRGLRAGTPPGGV